MSPLECWHGWYAEVGKCSNNFEGDDVEWRMFIRMASLIGKEAPPQFCLLIGHVFAEAWKIVCHVPYMRQLSPTVSIAW